MLLNILQRLQANPVQFLGSPSLTRLIAFETGYLLACPGKTLDYPIETPLREQILQRYEPSFDCSTLGASQILSKLAPEEERAFHLFFENLDTVVALHTNTAQTPVEIHRAQDALPIPVSGFLDVLSTRPAMFLPKPTPGHASAFLNGVGSACIDANRPELADLDGFEIWIGEN